MIVQSIFAFAILVYVDSGAPIPSFLRPRRSNNTSFKVEAAAMVDVIGEKDRLERGAADVLQVQRLKKKYRSADTTAVNDISFGVSEGETFALIGPNGAGKTTTLACIRGAVSAVGLLGTFLTLRRKFPIRATYRLPDNPSSEREIMRELQLTSRPLRADQAQTILPWSLPASQCD
jgi:ABC-type ATPase with predicted acetyltransferase domain